MSPLVSAAELAGLQADFARSFTTQATIKRPVTESDQLGDDDRSGTPTTVGTVMGALSSAPVAEQQLDGSSIVTANTYRWNCPVDTDIRPRDRLVIGDNTYTVSDTTKDESLPLCLSCTLRLRE